MVFWNKKIFKNANGEVHVGINAPEGLEVTDMVQIAMIYIVAAEITCKIE